MNPTVFREEVWSPHPLPRPQQGFLEQMLLTLSAKPVPLKGLFPLVPFWKDQSTDSITDGTSSGSPIRAPSKTELTRVHKLAPTVYSAEKHQHCSFPGQVSHSPVPTTSFFSVTYSSPHRVFGFILYRMISNAFPHLTFGVWAARR